MKEIVLNNKKNGMAMLLLFALLYLAAVDDDVTYAEAEFITECGDKLTALCDSAGVKPGKPGLRAKDFVTSAEGSFMDKNPPQTSVEGGGEKRPAGTAGSDGETPEEPAPENLYS